MVACHGSCHGRSGVWRWRRWPVRHSRSEGKGQWSIHPIGEQLRQLELRCIDCYMLSLKALLFPNQENDYNMVFQNTIVSYCFPLNCYRLNGDRGPALTSISSYISAARGERKHIAAAHKTRATFGCPCVQHAVVGTGSSFPTQKIQLVFWLETVVWMVFFQTEPLDAATLHNFILKGDVA